MYKSFQELGNKPEENKDQYEVDDLKDQTHKNNILSSHAIVCVDIYADWCGPCKQSAPDYSMIAQKYNQPGLCAVVKEQYERKLTNPAPGGLPTYQFFFMGKKVGQDIVGADIQSVEKKLQEMFSYLQNSQGRQQTQATQGPQHNRSTIRNYKNPAQDLVMQEQHQDAPPARYNQPYQPGQPRQPGQTYNQPGQTYNQPGQTYNKPGQYNPYGGGQ